MLSYQHHYHAGNHADVLKHWILVECIRHLKKKDKPFDYIDTHAGAGMYDLDSSAAQKTLEFQQGVGKLDIQHLAGFEHYSALIEDDLAMAQYPGSPMLVKRMMRPGDHAWLYDMHPQTVVELKQHCEQRRVSYVKQEDGFKGLLSLLPVKSKRAVVLIDPSYEIKSDYQRVVEVMSQAYFKAGNSMLLLWYPVVDRSLINRLEGELIISGMRNIQLFEMAVRDDSESGMTASGMVLVNPPWTLADEFKRVMPTVSEALSQDGVSRTRFVQLVAE